MMVGILFIMLPKTGAMVRIKKDLLGPRYSDLKVNSVSAFSEVFFFFYLFKKERKLNKALFNKFRRYERHFYLSQPVSNFIL